MPTLRLSLTIALAFLGFVARLASQPAAAIESALRTGTLPNGISYAVVPHPSPKGDLSLRLIVQAGSLDERDDERGFAHFVEHMAFNGTRQHPPGSLRSFFQRLGLTFGADLNASTNYTHTIYMLDLPDGRADQLGEGLGVLRDYADGQLFLPEEVKRESGVVLSELRARDSAGRRNALQMLQSLYAGTPVPEREVSGVPEQLERATPEQLRAFYQRNYVPNRMTVLLVGPIDPAAAVERITAAFGSIAAPAESPAAAPAPVPPPFDGVKPEVVVVPTAKSSNVELISISPRPPDTAEGHRDELVQRIATAALTNRLRERREREDPTRFGTPRAGFDAGPIGGLVHHVVAVSTTPAGWPDAVTIAESELRRARVAGFNQGEIDEAVAGQLTASRNRLAEFASRSAAGVATEVARFLALGRVWQPPAADLAETTRALEGLTAADATSALDDMFPADSLHLVVSCTPDETPKPERVLTAYNRSVARAIKTRSAADEALRFRYENFGAPGAVAKRERVEDLDLTLVSFANGAQLNLRPSRHETERFRLRVVFPLNLSNIPENRGGIADLAGHLLLNSNFSKQKQNELARLIKLHGIAPQFSVDAGTPVLAISGPAAELPFALQFLTALLSDLDFDLEHYRIALGRYGGQRQSMMINPGPLGQREALRAFTGNDPRVLLNPMQLFGNESGNDETVTWLRNHILNGPLEIGLVGDFTVDEAITQAAATIGTLRRRRPPPKAGPPLAAPKKATRGEGTAELPASTSLSCVMWPITLPDEPKQNAALTLAADVLRDRLLLVLREALGATYSPSTRVFRDPVQRDFAYISVVNTFDPEKARVFTEGSVRLAARFAEQGVSVEEFSRLREPARTRRTSDIRNNGWWLTIVAVAQSRPAVLEEARRHEKIFDEVTIADVNAAAQTFKSDRVTAVILRPTSAKAAPGAAPAKKAAPKKN